MFKFERAAAGQRVTWWTIIGLLLIPLLVAGGYVVTAHGAEEKVHSIPGAIVNNDDGTEIDGKTVPLGRQLAAALISPDDEDQDNLAWQLSDDEDAEEGLRNGKYATVVTIPKNFSERVMSISEDDGKNAEHATIDIQQSKVKPVPDVIIAKAITQAATQSFNKDFAKQYLDNIYLGFNEMSGQMKEAADGAGKLDDGAGELLDGTEQLDSGVQELNKGAQTLSSKGKELRSGADQLAGGANDLASGLNTMKDQTKSLPSQTKKLYKGADQLHGGIVQYTGEIDKVVTALDDFDADKLKKAVDAADKLDTSMNTIATGVEDMQKDVDKQLAAAKKLMNSDGTSKATSLDDLQAAGLMSAEEVARARAVLCPEPGSKISQQGAQQFQKDLQKAMADAGIDPEIQKALADPELQKALGSAVSKTACSTAERAFAAGISTASVGVLQKISDGLHTKGDSGLTLPQGLRKLADGTSELNAGIHDNLGDIEKNVNGLKDGKKKVVQAGKQLRDGSGQLADGTKKLHEGTGKLTDGIGQAADGADKLASGASKYRTGVGQYTDGVNQLAGGTKKLSDNTPQLVDGTTKLKDGTGEFYEQLEKGKDEIPTYDESHRSQLSDVVAASVPGESAKLSALSQNSVIGVLFTLLLWIGSLLTYTVLRAVPASAVTSGNPSWKVGLKSLAPGLAIAVIHAFVMTVLFQFIWGLGAGAFAGMFLLALLAGITFTVINFALVALMGGFGRILSAAMMVGVLSVNLISTAPTGLVSLMGMLPLAPAVHGFTALASGTPGAGAAVGQLIVWLVVGAAAALAAIASKRTVTVPRRPAYRYV